VRTRTGAQVEGPWPRPAREGMREAPARTRRRTRRGAIAGERRKAAFAAGPTAPNRARQLDFPESGTAAGGTWRRRTGRATSGTDPRAPAADDARRSRTPSSAAASLDNAVHPYPTL